VPVESGVKEAGEGWNVDQMKVVVDRQNGWPLRSTETLAGQFVDEIRLFNLVVDCPLDPASFTLEPPAVRQTFPSDGGFVGVGLDQVESIVGYRPVLPAPASLPAVTPLSSRDATFMVVPLSFLLLGWGRTVTPAAPARGPGVMTALTEPSAGSFPQGSIGGSEGIAASPPSHSARMDLVFSLPIPVVGTARLRRTGLVATPRACPRIARRPVRRSPVGARRAS
jgi:hypothetical protein